MMVPAKSLSNRGEDIINKYKYKGTAVNKLEESTRNVMAVASEKRRIF